MTSALTFAASANCGAYLGAVPRFADIEGATWNVSAGTIAAVTERTKVAIPVHFAGLPAPIRAIRAALPEQVVLIEDAAHALGARDAGVPVDACLDSDMAVFSFHPVNWHPYYAREYGYRTGLCPEAERYYAGCLSLPCFPSLGEQDQGRVAAAVLELSRDS